MIRNFFNFSTACIRVVLLTNPLTSGILFSTFPIFVVRVVLITKLLVSDIFFISVSYFLFKSCLSTIHFAFLRTSLSTTSLIFLNQSEQF